MKETLWGAFSFGCIVFSLLLIGWNAAGSWARPAAPSCSDATLSNDATRRSE